MGFICCGGSKKKNPSVGADANAPPESKQLKDENTVEAGTGGPPAFDFKVVLERAATESLGVQVDYPNSRNRLVLEVLKVRSDGLIPDWNTTNKEKPDLLIKPGDMIVDVNGTHGNLDKMMSEVNAKAVTLSIQRRAAIAPEAPAAAETAPAEAAVEAAPAEAAPTEAAVEPAAAEEAPAEAEATAEEAQAAEDVTLATAAVGDAQDVVQLVPDLDELAKESETKGNCNCGGWF